MMAAVRDVAQASRENLISGGGVAACSRDVAQGAREVAQTSSEVAGVSRESLEGCRDVKVVSRGREQRFQRKKTSIPGRGKSFPCGRRTIPGDAASGSGLVASGGSLRKTFPSLAASVSTARASRDDEVASASRRPGIRFQVSGRFIPRGADRVIGGAVTVTVKRNSFSYFEFNSFAISASEDAL